MMCVRYMCVCFVNGVCFGLCLSLLFPLCNSMFVRVMCCVLCMCMSRGCLCFCISLMLRVACCVVYCFDLCFPRVALLGVIALCFLLFACVVLLLLVVCACAIVF